MTYNSNVISYLYWRYSIYTEGIKIGSNSYLLSNEDGILTLLNRTGTQEELEEYIKLKNEYEEKRN